MTRQILLNLLIGFIWMFLENSWTLVTFVVGYLFGMLLLFLFRRFFPERFYVKNILAILNLIGLFIKELILSNIMVVKHVLNPTLTIRPGIFALPIDVKHDWEITVLANLITLTPGSVVVDISDDNKILYVHSVDIDRKETAIDEIKNSFEKAIMEVSR